MPLEPVGTPDVLGRGGTARAGEGTGDDAVEGPRIGRFKVELVGENDVCAATSSGQREGKGPSPKSAS